MEIETLFSLSSQISKTRTPRDTIGYYEQLLKINNQLTSKIETIKNQLNIIRHENNMIQGKIEGTINDSKDQCNFPISTEERKIKIANIQQEINKLQDDHQKNNFIITSLSEKIETFNREWEKIQNNRQLSSQLKHEINIIQQKIDKQKSIFDETLNKLCETQELEKSNDYLVWETKKPKIQEDIQKFQIKLAEIKTEKEILNQKLLQIQNETADLHQIHQKWAQYDFSLFEDSSLTTSQLIEQVRHPDPEITQKIIKLKQQLNLLHKQNFQKMNYINQLNESLRNDQN